MMKNTSDVVMTMIRKQCEMVGVNPDDIDFKKEGWYSEYSWTKEKEEEFKEWATKLLRKKFRWTKRKINTELGYYLLMWGWRREDDL